MRSQPLDRERTQCPIRRLREPLGTNFVEYRDQPLMLLGAVPRLRQDDAWLTAGEVIPEKEMIEHMRLERPARRPSAHPLEDAAAQRIAVIGHHLGTTDVWHAEAE